MTTALIAATLAVVVAALAMFGWRAYVRSRCRYDLVVQPGRFAACAGHRSVGTTDVALGERSSDAPFPAEPLDRAPITLQPDALVEPPRASAGMPGTRLIQGSSAYGTAAGVEVLESWSQVDEHTLRAVSQLTHGHVSNLADLRKTIDANNYHLESEHFQTMLRGHVGERFAADDFGQAGAHVQFFDASNNAGADFLVDGHPVNVKITLDAQHAASEHFAQYPDIPMVVNADAANIPADAITLDPSVPFDPSVLQGGHVVLVDPGLHLDAVGSATSDSLGAADGTAGLAGAAFPTITIALAAGQAVYREWQLFQRGATTPQRAVGNVGKDVTTRATGVWVGATGGLQLGVAIDGATGGLLLGMPTLVLTVGGAVVGSKAGQKIGKRWRERPMRKAQESLDSALGLAREATGAANGELSALWNREAGIVSRTLHDAAMQGRQRLDYAVWESKQHLEVAETVSDGAQADLLERAVTEMRSSPTPRPCRRRGPIAAVERRADASALQHALRTWEKQAKAARSLVDPRTRMVTTFDLIMVGTHGQAEAAAYLEHVAAARRMALDRAVAVSAAVASDLMRARVKADVELAELTSRWTVRAMELEDQIKPLLDEYELARIRYVTECRAAGYDVSESVTALTD